MLKQYVKLFLETSFANQSQTFSDILNSIHDQDVIAQRKKELEQINKDNKELEQINKDNKELEQINKDNKELEQKNIDFEDYSSLLNRGPQPRGLQFVSTPPKKRQ